MRVVPINTVKNTILAATIGIATMSCSRNAADQAKDKATKYINGIELFDAERTACVYANYVTPSEFEPYRVAYWDSILTEYKIKEAFNEGKSAALKSDKEHINTPAKYYFDVNERKNYYETSSEIKNLEFEIAKRTTAVQLLKLRKQAPKIRDNSAPAEILFWNKISTSYKCKQAFKDGVKFIKDSIKNSMQHPSLQKMEIK